MSDGGGISEKELTCAICTEVLYQPLALLDCLHTFCGACLKEWFKWQATSASSSRRGIANPYTCPSCRDSVRRTKADWRLNTLLEGFLKAHPEKVKSEQEKKELGEHYKPGDDVLPPVAVARGRADSEDERLLAQARDLSMRDLDAANSRRRRGHDQSTSARLTESTMRAHDNAQPRIEHQSSLRSLLSVSDDNSQDVQADILRSIYSEGLLEGIDLDSLTSEQEEELTEKIAEAYRRRHPPRDRTQARERHHRRSRSPRSTITGAETQSTPRTPENRPDSQQQSPRSRPPVSRPHLFEQTLQDPSRAHTRSRSSTSQRSGQSDTAGPAISSASRSATDLSQAPTTSDAQGEQSGRPTSSGRSITDPRPRSSRDTTVPGRIANSTATRELRAQVTPDSNRSALGPAHQPGAAQADITTSTPDSNSNSRLHTPQQAVRPAVSMAAFAPEPVVDESEEHDAHQIACNRCQRRDIQHDLHYNCRWCQGGAFNLCMPCYRDGRGCDHWFGFGYRAIDRWSRNAPPEGWPIGFDRPHVLVARQFVKAASQVRQMDQHARDYLLEGAFCESCHGYANDCYWYCNVCLEGAWGFCDNCVKQGKHCTHPLLVVAHISTVQGSHCDPSKLAFVGMPHLRQDTYVNLPVTTGCDICDRSIEPNTARYHCYQCNEGDYDICTDCYRNLVSQGKITEANGPNGWRRCLQGHRMGVVGFQDTAEGGHLRMTIREAVGGWALQTDGKSLDSQLPWTGVPPDGGVGMKCLALYNYFPKDGVADELSFPKNAQIREVEDKNGDWFVGVYAGRVRLFPSNHVRTL